MKRLLFPIFLFLFSISVYSKTIDFDQYFYNKTLRVDLIHSGMYQKSEYSFLEMKEEPYWAGSRVNLLDTFDYGTYKVSLYDQRSGQEIYSRTFSSLFFEWQTTAESKSITKSFYETVVMPFPKEDVRMVLFERNANTGIFESKYVQFINPKSYFIKKGNKYIYPFKQVLHTNDPANSVDIVLLPEGYTEKEMGKFDADCKKFSESLLSIAPFDKYKNNININAIMAPSIESGADIPANGIWKNTLLDCSFYTFDSERYIMTENVPKVRDVASNVPYDIIYILVNTDKYGGGAIYNDYSVSVMNNSYSKEIFLHEMGHLFAGLADEYYTSETSYVDFYNYKLEPWEPNITTLVNFERKWKSTLSKQMPIPTPRTKEYENALGVFEGGGYSAKGIYSPVQSCLMKSLGTKSYCPVCTKAIEDVILFYIK